MKIKIRRFGGILTVSAKPAFRLYGFNWVVHRGINILNNKITENYEISCIENGACLPIGYHVSAEGAIRKARKLLLSKGREKIIKAHKRWIKKYGKV